MIRSPVEILLVEDNPGDVRLFKEALWETGMPHHLHSVDDGEKALNLLFDREGRATYPDVVILDINLPKLSGHEVLRAIKQDARTRTLPVIVLSSSRAKSDVQQAYESNANCYLQKPNNLEDLFRIVFAIESFWLNTAQLPGTFNSPPKRVPN
jgi:two-component system, chemotaxis family, response regulator Rcp1